MIQAKPNRLFPAFCLALLMAAHSGHAAPPAAKTPPSPLARPLATLLAAEPGTDTNLVALYRAKGFKPFWIAGGEPSARAKVLRHFLDDAGGEGLRPEDYGTEAIGRLWLKSDPDSLARLELLLTQGYLRYAADVGRGRDAARRLEEQAQATPSAAPRKGLETPGLAPFLEHLAPQHPEYAALKQALKDYRALAQQGGWPTIPSGPTLQPGMSDPRIPSIRQRLALTDAAEPGHGKTYDEALAAAVKRFQKRHALPPQGVIGPETLAALNVPVEQRIRQIIVNLERWRWLSADRAGRQIWVNIPSFTLWGLQDGAVEITMPVVVGKLDQPTPAFDERLEYLEFNPDWHVPHDIAINEYLPELRKNPASLKPKHIRFFSGGARDAPEIDPRGIDWNLMTPATMERYVLRQDPGPWNALGTVKFMFPNKYNVYLHDTSEPRFFARSRRTYSHGCVRVGQPYELAAWVLAKENPPWTLERVQATIASGEHTSVALAKAMPVHLIYRTAWVEGDRVHFAPDIYNRDAALERVLSGG